MLTKDDRAKLRELAEKATPGPWQTGTGGHWGRDVRAGDGAPAWCGGHNGCADAAFIAANEPVPVSYGEGVSWICPPGYVEQLRDERDRLRRRKG
jgi:hypothetical protein